MSKRKQRRRKVTRTTQQQRRQGGRRRAVTKTTAPEAEARPPINSRRWIFVCLLAGLVLRLGIAWQGDFLLHPDEVFQYLEQAHRLVFGYGTVPWEYRYGTRPWLVPGFAAAWLWLFKLAALDTPDFYINGIKAVFCIVSLGIPLGMYLFARRHFSETAALLALILGCFWYELAGFAHKPLTTLVGTAFLIMYLGLDNCNASLKSVWVLGVFGVLTCMIRLQLAPVAGVLMLLSFYRFSFQQRKHFASAIAVTFIACGLLDYLTWGSWWHTLSENMYLNFTRNISSVFGASPVYTYFYYLLLTTGGLFYIAIGFALVNPSRYWLLLSCLLLIVGSHSMIAHKEYRFIFAVTPLWLLLIADLLTRVRATWQRAVAFGIIGLISLSGLLFFLPFQPTVYGAQIGVQLPNFRFLKPQAHLRAYRELSQDDGVSGVLDLTKPWALSGGYYYLHRKVPLYDPNLYMRFLKGKLLNEYVSHILTTTNVRRVRGFTNQKRIGDLIIWRRKPLSQLQKTWRYYQITHYQPGVDNVLGKPIKPENQIIMVEPE